jgi:hydroxymethylbilane synthase
MSNNSLTIGTRGSALALVQTHWVRDELLRLNPHLDIHVLIIQTTGDKSQAANTPLSTYSEKGVFAKELETALIDGDIDLAVHSMKDMASILPEGLCIAAVPERHDVRDALVGKSLNALSAGDRVGTGSVRRSALLRHHYPILKVVDIRGNVDTRIRKLKDGEYDSIVLAAAGLGRLGRSSEIAEILDPELFVPDPGQGALAIEAREGDERIAGLLAPLNHRESFAAITAERAFLAEYGGGCQTPVGAWAKVEGETMHLTAMAALGNTVPHYIKISGPADTPIELGKSATNYLQTSEKS